MRRTLCSLLALLGLGLAGPAAAEAPVEWNPLYYENLLAGRFNPAGLQDRASPRYRHRLLDPPTDSLRLGDTWLGTGATASLTPTCPRAVGEVRLVPMAMLRLGARLASRASFGSFQQLTSWPGPATADWSGDGIDARDNAAPGTGWRGTLEGRLQARVGPIASRDTLQARYTALPLPAGDTVYCDQALDLLQPGEGWSFANDADLLSVGLDDWVLGARGTWARAVHEGGGAANDWTIKAGPLIAHTLGAGSRALHRPTVFLLTQWYVAHPWRAGQATSQARPMVAAGVGWSGDLVPKP